MTGAGLNIFNSEHKHRYYGQSESLLLDGLLQVDVVLVGDVQGQFELGDLDLHLLLYTLNLGLQPHFGFHHASIQLLDFDAGLFAINFIQCKFKFSSQSIVLLLWVFW